jgi:glycosyltransferase involved in cell wall biosynthesis
MLISVVMCTYNRASRLAATLENLQNLVVPEGVTWELVVVDNRSSDNTAEVISDIASRTSLPIRYTYEALPGIGAARNRGIIHSAGTIVAFIDDDIYPSQDWLCVLVREFTEDSLLHGLGGRVELHNPLDLPVTIRTSKERFQMHGTWNLLGGLPGCNMAFRRTALHTLDGFDPDFGTGAPLISAEDIEFMFRAIREDMKLVYSPDLLVTHDHGRRTQAQVDALMRTYLIGRGAMYAKHALRFDPEMIRMAGREVIQNLQEGAGDLIRARLPRKPVKTLWLLANGFWLAVWHKVSGASQNESCRLEEAADDAAYTSAR